MEQCKENTIVFSDDTKVNELSVNRHAAPLWIERRGTTLTLRSSEPFTMARYGTRLIAGAMPTIAIKFSPLRASLSFNGKEETYYRRPHDDRWLPQWYNVTDIQEKRESQISYFRGYYELQRHIAFRDHMCLENEEKRASYLKWQKNTTEEDITDETEREEYRAFQGHKDFFMLGWEAKSSREIEQLTTLLDDWLASEYHETREKIERDIVAAKEKWTTDAPSYAEWSFTGASLSLEFLNVHGESFAVDLYNRTLTVMSLVTNCNNKYYTLAPYMHLHMTKVESSSAVTIETTNKPIPLHSEEKRSADTDIASTTHPSKKQRLSL